MDRQLPLFTFDAEELKKVSDTENEPQEGESDFSKYIVYVDESGDHSLNSIDEKYPVFVLSLCIFHKRHYSEVVVPALEKFKFNYFGHDQVVLHENEIRKRIGVFNIFKNKEHQGMFINDLADIIEFSNFIIISATIDKLKLKAGLSTNAYDIALKICIDRLYEFFIEKGQESKKTFIVFESRGTKEDSELELEFRRICDGRNKHGLILPFDIIFSDKKVMSSGLQLADLVARPIGLHTLRPDQPNRAFGILKNKFFCRGGRNKLGVDYKGVGLNIYPQKSEKPR